MCTLLETSGKPVMHAFGAPSTASARWENPPHRAKTVLGVPVLQRSLPAFPTGCDWESRAPDADI